MVLLLGFDIILALAEIGSPSPHLASVDCSLSEGSHEAEFVLHFVLRTVNVFVLANLSFGNPTGVEFVACISDFVRC